MMFSERLFTLRDENRLTKVKLAKELGTTRQLIAMYENGTTLPTISLFSTIADYFGVSADYLLGREDYAELSYNRDKECIYLPRGLTDEDNTLIKDFISMVYKRRSKKDEK